MIANGNFPVCWSSSSYLSELLKQSSRRTSPCRIEKALSDTSSFGVRWVVREKRC